MPAGGGNKMKGILVHGTTLKVAEPESLQDGVVVKVDYRKGVVPRGVSLE